MPAAAAPCAATNINRSVRTLPTATRKAVRRVVAGSVEFRQRILSDYGFAAFLDGGQVAASGSPFVGGLKLGAGIGARYYTSFGRLRLDVAVPLTKIPNGGSFEIYLGIGQAF